MSFDIDEKEFYETFAEITQDRGLDEAKRWAWIALDWTQQELRERNKENDELRKHGDVRIESSPKKYEAGKPSELAQRVTEAFRSSAADAVAVNLARGNTVVGEVNGEWIDTQEERARVVAWLREEAEAAAQTFTLQAGEWANRIDGLANSIESGEHRCEEEG